MGLKVVPSKVNHVAGEIALMENVHNVIICGGRYDILLGAVFQDVNKLSDFLLNKLSSITSINSTETIVTLRVVKASLTFMTSEECLSVDVNVKRNIDALDLMIIRELQTNSQQSQAIIAKKIGVGATTVRRRLNRLLDDRVIRIIAIADPRAFGYHIRAAIGIKISPDKIDSVADTLASYANVHYALITTGPYDLVVWTVFRDIEELSIFIRHDLGNIEGLVNYECMLILKVTKDLLRSPTRNL
jgi:Lrp/AsnC family transcriptional regulator for asnA, asnC and gidA